MASQSPTRYTYVIGDVQGCIEPLQALLNKIEYDPGQDALWFTGDLVNRGPHSLETLRFVKQLPATTVCVLGNHDLALLAVAAKAVHPRTEDTFHDILSAPDKEDLIDWLRHLPILHHDSKKEMILTHAGVYPLWDVQQAKSYATELEDTLRGPHFSEFLQHMYGDQPVIWQDSLTSWDRLRFFTNAFTRMRFVTSNGALDLHTKGSPSQHPNCIPWYQFAARKQIKEKMVFGHWAALNGQCPVPTIFALDTGCAWGKCLTAFCLTRQKRFSIDCGQYTARFAQNQQK